ncbi:MAG: polyribonucleotide nucleotidyltransferase [Bacteroidia bacterium]|nr:polyribonucleotide nucleotidyltransferase [Bacteroidia bacterium]MCX7651524.1 polyribonucleotide nucleotidyltransferase [Bacteroidia bacterium]MDW8416821.1 polyribonucleotide nucleotidyltransferase [Bacteroidia bacterium]
MSKHTEVFEIEGAEPIQLHFGHIARQADGAVWIQQGGTIVICTACAGEKESDTDFVPLTVDYRENFSSSGRIPGGFIKRDGRPNEAEVLTSRLIDRSLRPFFPKGWRKETQLIAILESYDPEYPSDVLAGLGLSAALALSSIPTEQIVATARIIRKNGEFLLNPPAAHIEGAELNLVVSGTQDSIVMVEGEMQEVEETTLVDALRHAHEYIKQLIAFLENIQQRYGKPKATIDPAPSFPEIAEQMEALLAERLYNIVKSSSSKQARREAFEYALQEASDALVAQNPDWAAPEVQKFASTYFAEMKRRIMREVILNEGVRLDGRRPDEIRPIWCEVGVLPRTHGSAIFTRGETQALATVTLGTKQDEQIIDYATQQGTKKFLLQYNFPPFSTGEVKPLRAPSRREVGHSHLAERALRQVIPTEGDFADYTIRVVSDILESNGSSSMATVCAGCLALMDAGVPLKAPVAGIAMGLIWSSSERYAVLTDILGDEDALGDMDFKVAGTARGLTACQMDIKIQHMPYEVLGKALLQAKQARLFILEQMLAVLPQPRTELSPYAPRIYRMSIPFELIGAVIGTGGKVIQEIQRTTGTTITIEQDEKGGTAVIYAQDKAALEKAAGVIREIISEPEIGQVYSAKVKFLKEAGAVVEFMRGKEGFLHISEIVPYRVEKIEDVLRVGQELPVKYLGVDARTGKYRVSHKAVNGERGSASHSERPPRRPSSRPQHSHRRS